ncbi:MAG: NAD-dependent epimerase/dehydratase family protein [Patescibacteria group bacterium]
MKDKVVVLGAKGMTGRIVFRFLKNYFPNSIFGTTRNKSEIKKNLFLFRAQFTKKDFEIIQKKLKKIDFVINCIGIVEQNAPTSKLIHINSLFPHILLELSKKHNFKIIHVSSDAVFSSLAGKVDEISPASADSNYGISKLLGELRVPNALNIRTSIIGLDPIKHKGILEWAKRAKQKKLRGFTNQIWTGCTTCQFATLCKYIIQNNRFSELSKQSNIYHFAPVGPVTKFRIIKEFLQLIRSSKVVEKSHGKKISRALSSYYLDSSTLNKYTRSLPQALKELLDFEKELI